MIEYDKLLLKTLSDRLDHLTWHCTGCPQAPICESQTRGGGERYCWPILRAAILGEETWTTDHDPEDLHNKCGGEGRILNRYMTTNKEVSVER